MRAIVYVVAAKDHRLSAVIWFPDLPGFTPPEKVVFQVEQDITPSADSISFLMDAVREEGNRRGLNNVSDLGRPQVITQSSEDVRS